ncbi:MAG: hypothetical protein DRI34_06830 [Deltaproteobacteria bacterium]|nr:MAG: hypothetical protein DRI34_06830 [Deltaproteobacteria bacterium]
MEACREARGRTGASPVILPRLRRCLLCLVVLLAFCGCSWVIGVREERKDKEGEGELWGCRKGPAVADTVFAASGVVLATLGVILADYGSKLAEGLACGGDFPESTCTTSGGVSTANMVLAYIPALMFTISATTGWVSYSTCKDDLQDRPDSRQAFLPGKASPRTTVYGPPPPASLVNISW